MSLPYEPAYWDSAPIMDAVVHPIDQEEDITPDEAETRYIRHLIRVRQYLDTHDLEDELPGGVEVDEFTITA